MFDVPPPAGFVTVTFTVPAVAMSAAGIVATIWVLVTDEGVIAALEPKFTVAPVTKPVPVRVNVKAAPLTVAVAGAIEVSVGPETALIVNDRLPDVPPPGAGFVTVTVAVPAVAISAAVIAAVNCVALTKVVVLDAPLNFTTDVDTKARSIDSESEGSASSSGTRGGKGGFRRRRIIDGEGLSVRYAAAGWIRDRNVHRSGRGYVGSRNRCDDLGAGNGRGSNCGTGSEIHRCSTYKARSIYC